MFLSFMNDAKKLCCPVIGWNTYSIGINNIQIKAAEQLKLR